MSFRRETPTRSVPGRRFSRALVLSVGIHASVLGLGLVFGGLGSQVFSRSPRAFAARFELPPETEILEPHPRLDPLLPELEEPELVESDLWSEPEFEPDPGPPSTSPLRWPSDRPQLFAARALHSQSPAPEPAPTPVAEALPLAASATLESLDREIVEAAPVFSPAPDYPRRSVRAGQEGSVLVRLELASDGRVERALVLESSGHERLDEAARATLLTWRFAPRTVGGLAVGSEFTHRVTFQLNRD